jgi:ATP-dependent DNA helicase DinG
MTIATAPKSFSAAEVILAANLPGYTPRPQQQRLALAIEELIERAEGQLVVQAGCGTGKSIAGLIPAILSGMRVLIVTATKALQEQYATKDLPFLQQHLGVPFEWAVLKGRANYFCGEKGGQTNPQETPSLPDVLAELSADEDHSGDREHFTTPITDFDWMRMSSSTVDCIGPGDCPVAKMGACHSELAKAKAAKAQIVVTNTSMLMIDLMLRGTTEGAIAILGDYDMVIIDEAHELGEIATGQLGDTIRQGAISRLAEEIKNFAFSMGAAKAAEAAGDAVATSVMELWMELGDPDTNGDAVQITQGWIMEHEQVLGSLVVNLGSLGEALDAVPVDAAMDFKSYLRKLRLTRRIQDYITRVEAFVFTPFPDARLSVEEASHVTVRWIETEISRRGKSLVLKSAPLDVGPFLARTLWETERPVLDNAGVPLVDSLGSPITKAIPVVLMSATMSVGNDWSYLLDTLGLRYAKTLDVGTPFDYSTQARLFVPPKDAPVPAGSTREAWRAYTQATTLELIRKAGGGALLLYTSRREMDAAYASMASTLSGMGIQCLKQGEATNKHLAEVFKTNENSVLFALKSFMVGVDFQGRTCRLVVVDKLPFPVPTDILFAARSKIIDAKYGNWAAFNRLSVPIMALTLIQAFGRLIRHREDFGIVAILDPRLRTKPYGRKILGALPGSPVIGDVGAAEEFFVSHGA